jgi:hypothetical protein
MLTKRDVSCPLGPLGQLAAFHTVPFVLAAQRVPGALVVVPLGTERAQPVSGGIKALLRALCL